MTNVYDGQPAKGPVVDDHPARLTTRMIAVRRRRREAASIVAFWVRSQHLNAVGV